MKDENAFNLTRPPVLHGSPTFLISLYFVFKIIPALAATLTIYLGYRLFILGVSGQASLSVNSRSINGQLLNATPGLFFVIGGLVTLSIIVRKSVNIARADQAELHQSYPPELQQSEHKAPANQFKSAPELQLADFPYLLTYSPVNLECPSCKSMNRRWRVPPMDIRFLRCENCGNESEMLLQKRTPETT